ncbi:pentatricopeptide repeat-containing protein At2g41080-like isoform X2 [Arachis stenosperma]|uniref:pentatricopeptide repeat-containing protein At2g41080-like isoform X2 n=1 Tax=Arachis stenosperma TaxID=217475 RepID=UPI0025AB91B2|nr:pentatricopeptide repeat-containing protein At2g41080-like isoform X2 [Arachis stenosperma]
MEQAQIAQSGFSNSRFTGRNFNGRRGGRGGCFGCGGRFSWQSSNTLDILLFIASTVLILHTMDTQHLLIPQLRLINCIPSTTVLLHPLLLMLTHFGTLTQVPAIISHTMHQISLLPMTIQALISFSLQTVNKAILLHGILKHDLYAFDNLTVPPSLVDNSNFHIFLTKCNLNLTLWRRRLGHPSSSVIKTVLKQCNLPIESNTISDSFICDHCAMSKMHVFPFSASNTTYFLAHYTCLVGAMARAGHLEQAERVALTMPYKPDAAVWRALLSACAFHGEADKAWSMARRVLELEPLDDSAYVIVANVLSAAGRWDDVAELRKMLRDRRVKKQGGRSWIEVQGKVHVFAAGDWKHERSAEIYRKLEEIMGEIEKLGYVPIWDELLHNVEEEKRKEALWHHSEKLAVAFGMLCGSAPPGKPLRIVKNLRICKDCHEAKYMTRILEREIIVRDVNRYHRFVDGNCTCRDIW